MTPAYVYAARIVRIIDGDSVAMNVDVGFRTFHESAFRLAGIDAPEVNVAGPEGEAARDYLGALLPFGRAVTIETFKSPDKYGRFLAMIHLADGTNVNQRMIDAGHARSYDGGAR